MKLMVINPLALAPSPVQFPAATFSFLLSHFPTLLSSHSLPHALCPMPAI